MYSYTPKTIVSMPINQPSRRMVAGELGLCYPGNRNDYKEE